MTRIPTLSRRWLVRSATAAAVIATLAAAMAAPAQASDEHQSKFTNSNQGGWTPTGGDTTPYLGWSSWSLQATRDTTLNPNGSYSWLTEANILAQAKALAGKLKAAGYTYINIDAGWWRKWDWTPEYDSNGRYAVDTTRFPHGIQYTIDAIHRLGLKVGIYVPVGLEKGAYDNGDFQIAGSPTCSTHDVVYSDLRTTNGWDSSYAMDFSNPCAQAWVNSEVKQFSDWGVDF
ncbi:MAG: hypothetical protein QOE89_2728, partial [Pseudonocardiales bacterium]|nr:hypothetical protein [Pseudonocardiales bacterium]